MRQVQRQSTTLRKVAFAVSFAAIAGAVLFVMNNVGTSEEALANPGKDGAKTISTANAIVNEYTYLISNASAGGTQIQCNSNTINANGRFSGNLAAGDLLLIIQMQGASVNTGNTSSYGSVSAYNSAGLYEFAKDMVDSYYNKEEERFQATIKMPGWKFISEVVTNPF